MAGLSNAKLTFLCMAEVWRLTGLAEQICLCVCVKTFYKLKGNRPVTRPQLLQESLDLCAEAVTQKLVSYSMQAERYLKDSVNGQLIFILQILTVLYCIYQCFSLFLFCVYCTLLVSVCLFLSVRLFFFTLFLYMDHVV